MELKLIRRFKGENYTIGDLYINGKFFCNVLEDKVRPLIDLNKDGDFNDEREGKIFGQTAIPEGKYRILITHSYKFKRELPLLLNVPGFKGIRIHGGNTKEDTEGCLLVGINSVVGKVTRSTEHLRELMRILYKSLSKEKVFIVIE